MPDRSQTTVSRTRFGTMPDGRDVERYELGLGVVTAAVITYGARLQSVRVPDRSGTVADVVLGFDDLAGYLLDADFHGAVVGRFGNRIAGGRFSLDGTEHVLPQNHGTSTLHGGPGGFHAQVWDAEVVADGVRLWLVSPDGDQGFPGTLQVQLTLTLSPDGLRWDYLAATDAPTVVNLTNHAYWNLGGTGAGTVEDHVVSVAASRYVPVDADLVPLAGIADVEGTVMDLREPVRLGERLRRTDPQLLHARGYDHCFLLDAIGTGAGAGAGTGTMPEAARVHDPRSGRSMTVLTDEPGVQLYTGNVLDGSVVGRGGVTLRQTDALCLETEHLPDSPNRPDFPSTVLRPGQEYRSSTVVRLSAG